MRTVEVTVANGDLFVTGFLSPDPIVLIAQSDTLFTSVEGLSYEFIKDGQGGVTHIVEIHASGNYPYQRRR
jgi:hypothetical protein